jgi:threonine aldolase
MAALVDLRSDTVTRPTSAMRKAMAEAEVGDDVYGEDPTIHRLQERVAELLGVEAALFVPSGSMANQIGIRSHTQPGDEVIIGWNAHCWRHESGSIAALSGLQTQMMSTPTFTAADVRAAYRDDSDAHSSPTRVVAVENTHNMGGGIPWDPAQLLEVTAAAHALGMATHLDGARLWNAAVASKLSEKELARGFDSISVCLSKGLGAPIGSLVCGTKDVVRRCHRFRKMYGGGMRQAGILAAAGLYALDHHRPRLHEDHANARALAEALAGTKGLAIDLERTLTNLVMIEPRHKTPAEVIETCKKDGVLLGQSGPKRIRAVTHLDVDREGVMRAAKVIAAAL